MELIKLINDTPVTYSVASFRNANPHTIYGNTISDSSLNEQDVYRVRTLPEPTVNIGQKAVKSTTATQSDTGEWVYEWTVVSLTADEARELRNKLLSETDWTGNSDVTMSDEMTAYRQALRDLPEVTDFPAVTYPEKP
jgi:hypothetical protein